MTYTLVGPTVTGPVQDPPSCAKPRQPAITAITKHYIIHILDSFGNS